MSAKVEDQVDPVFLAMSKLRRGYYDECIDICTNLLARIHGTSGMVVKHGL